MPPLWTLPTVSRIPQKPGFGSCHDVFCHVHAHCYWIFPQSSSACHVDPLPVIPCPAMTCHIIPCPAAPWPKTQVMSYRVRSCPWRCNVLPLFVASKQVLTVGAMYDIPCSVCIKNALNHINKNSAQNVHARHLDVHFRPSATHTEQDARSSPNQG